MFNYLKKHNMRNSLKMLMCLTAICVFSNNAAAKICFLPDGDCGKTKITDVNSGKNGCIYKTKGEADTGKNDECEVSYQSQVNSCWWRRCNSDNKTIFDKLADCQKKIEDATKQECQACGSCYKLVTSTTPFPDNCPSGYSTKYQSPSDCGANESFSENGTYNGLVCGACTKTETCPSGYSTQYQSQKDCQSGETFSSSGMINDKVCGKCTKVVKPVITIKTKEFQGECEEWEDENGNIHNCLAKVITSFTSKVSDGKSYNVALSIDGRNIVTDYAGNEINDENSQHCKYTMANYPQNIPENKEICTYEDDEFTIYTEDDQIECNVSSMPEYLAVNVNGETILSNLKISGKGFPLNDFNGKTYETDNYTIKFVQAVDYCKDISNSYISQNDTCSATQDKVIADGVTAEKDGQCYTCVTKSEYTDKAILCCSLGYQEREYMGVIRDWYEWRGYGDFPRSDCQTIDLMWRDVVKEYQNNDDYETEYSQITNYPNKYGCLDYGKNGKWHIGWFGFDAEESTAGCGISEDNRAWDFGPYIEGSLYNYTGSLSDGFYKQRLILSNQDKDKYNDVATICSDDIPKWLDEHKSNATMCRYNFTTVTDDDEAYYTINNIENDMMNHCWYRDAYGRDVTDSINVEKRADVAKNKIEPMDSSIKDNSYLVGEYAKKYNNDLVNTCKGYSFNKERLTPLIIDMKN